jgi:large subunit ribosomal protein L10
MMAQALERSTIRRKAQEVEKIVSSIDQYNVLAFASLHKVRAIQLQELAKRFRSDILLKTAKNVIVRRALERSAKRNINELTKHLIGSNLLLLTDMNPFKLSILLGKNKIKTTAKAGDLAQNDITIPAGNTGLPPGPAISELHEAGVRTRIESGSVWVIRDTVVAEMGEAIPAKVASVLSKLGVKPLEVSLQLVAAYEDGLIFTTEQLSLDLNDTTRQFEEAHNQAINLSVNATYPTGETIPTILQRAHLEARSLALNAAYLTSEVAAEVLARAYSQMTSLASQIAKINKDAAPKGFQG